MNAKFLEHFIAYREAKGLSVAKTLLSKKIEYQFAILGQRKVAEPFLNELSSTQDIQRILLIEARAARLYWRKFAARIGTKTVWQGREAHRNDMINKLLDIGYHYLAQKIINICQEINLPTELGIFHRAQSAKAHPLVYDFMETMRPIIVDEVLLKIIRRKKLPITKIDRKFISTFVYHMKKKGETRYFNRKLNYCIELNYWIRLLLLEFMGSVRFRSAYHPLFPSLRHESRCKEKTAPIEKAVT
jgi:CRISPR-associated endonuclease Cas1